MSATHLVEFHGLPVFDLPGPDAAVPLPAADAVAWRVRYDWNGSEEFEAVWQRFLDTVRTEDVCALIIGAWGGEMFEDSLGPVLQAVVDEKDRFPALRAFVGGRCSRWSETWTHLRSLWTMPPEDCPAYRARRFWYGPYLPEVRALRRGTLRMDQPENFAYAEDHCALNLSLLAMSLYGPVALFALCLVLGSTVSSGWFDCLYFAPVYCLVVVSLLYRNWPTGIRVDERGVRIGAVASKGGERRIPTVTHQNWAVFSCPWSGVREMFVVTDPGQVRLLRTSPEYYTLSNRWAKPKTMIWCMAGVLVPPFMRAALVIRIDPAVATVPAFRSALFFSNYMDPSDPHFSRRLQTRVGNAWVVPTRHPERLRALIKEQLHPGAPTPKRKPRQR